MGDGRRALVTAIVQRIIHRLHLHALRLVPVRRGEGQLRLVGGGISSHIGHGDHHIRRRLATQHHRVAALILLFFWRLRIVRLGYRQCDRGHNHTAPIIIIDGHNHIGNILVLVIATIPRLDRMGDGRRALVTAIVQRIIHRLHLHALRLVPVRRGEGQLRLVGGGISSHIGHGDHHIRRRLATQHHRVAALILLFFWRLRIVRLGYRQCDRGHNHTAPIIIIDGHNHIGNILVLVIATIPRLDRMGDGRRALVTAIVQRIIHRRHLHALRLVPVRRGEGQLRLVGGGISSHIGHGDHHIRRRLATQHHRVAALILLFFWRLRIVRLGYRQCDRGHNHTAPIIIIDGHNHIGNILVLVIATIPRLDRMGDGRRALVTAIVQRIIHRRHLHALRLVPVRRGEGQLRLVGGGISSHIGHGDHHIRRRLATQHHRVAALILLFFWRLRIVRLGYRQCDRGHNHTAPIIIIDGHNHIGNILVLVIATIPRLDRMGDGRRALVTAIVQRIIHRRHLHALRLVPVRRGEGQLRLVGGGISSHIGHGDHHIRRRLATQHHRVAALILLFFWRLRIVRLGYRQCDRGHNHTAPIIIIDGHNHIGNILVLVIATIPRLDRMGDGRRALVTAIVQRIIHRRHLHALRLVPVRRGEGQLRLVGGGISSHIGHGDHHIRRRLATQHHRVAALILLFFWRLRIVRLGYRQCDRGHNHTAPIIIIDPAPGTKSLLVIVEQGAIRIRELNDHVLVFFVDIVAIDSHRDCFGSLPRFKDQSTLRDHLVIGTGFSGTSLRISIINRHLLVTGLGEPHGEGD